MNIHINEYLNEQILSIKENSYKFNLEKAQFIIYNLTKISKKHIDENGYISVCSDIFRKNTMKEYSKYLETFIKYGIIERKNYSTKFKRCNKYRFLIPNHIEVERMSEITIKSIGLRKKDKARIMQSAVQNNKHLYNCLVDEDFTIDYNGAINTIYALDCRFCIKINLLQSVIDLRDKNIRFICHSDTDKRIHTNITNLKSILRQHLYYKNEKLVNIDIKNSQVYFLAMVLHLVNIKSIDYLNSINKYTISNNSSQLLDITELERFIDLAVTGNFYEVLGNELLNEKGGYHGYYEKIKYNKKTDRKVSEFYDNPKKLMKSTTFEILFSKNTDSDEKKWFRTKFPTIYKFIYNFKEGDSKDLSRFLQNLEADIILKKIIKELKLNDPKIFLITIHDSIMTTKNNIDLVKNTISKVTRGIFGFSPTLTVE